MSLLNEYISKKMGGKELKAELLKPISDKSMEKEQAEKTLITFLKRTKDGEYAKIDERQLAYPRVKEQREPYYNDEEYYYSLR